MAKVPVPFPIPSSALSSMLRQRPVHSAGETSPYTGLLVRHLDRVRHNVPESRARRCFTTFDARD